MKRRSFLQALAAFMVAPIPKGETSTVFPATIDWVVDELRPEPVLSWVSLFESEFGGLELRKLADIDDRPKYSLQGKEAPFPCKVITLSPVSEILDDTRKAQAMTFQIERRAHELLRDMLCARHGEDWRDAYEHLLHKHITATDEPDQG